MKKWMMAGVWLFGLLAPVCAQRVYEAAQFGIKADSRKNVAPLVEKMLAVTKNCEEKVLAISHCNCPERAKRVCERIEKLAHFKKIVIVDTAGVSSMYANDGGIIVAM